MAITRRDLLERSGLLALSSAVWPNWMPRMVFRNPSVDPSGDILIVVFARGGYDGLNMVIPYGNEAEYFSYRKTIGIPAPDSAAANKAIDLDGFFGLHPALGASNQGRWKEWYDSGHLAIIQAVHQMDPTRSHFDAMDFMERGTPGQKTLNSGWLGRHLSTKASQRNSPFRAVGLGTMVQASLRGPVPAVALQSIADFHLQGRQTEITRFQQHLESLYGGDGWLDKEGQNTFQALDLLQKAISTTTYKAENGAKYVDNNGFHRGLMQVAQLIKADVGLEVACMDIGGWDTHANQVAVADPTTGTHAGQMNSLATGISAFMLDLWPYFDKTEMGKQGITVIVMSEFGRRIGENGGRGTDHGHGNTMFVLGKGINGKKVYGTWPGLAEEFQDRGDLRGTTEYRDILAEILTKRAGNKRIADVFPNKTFSALGLANALDTVAVPTSVPPTPVPTPKPTEPVITPPKPTIFLPWVQHG